MPPPLYLPGMEKGRWPHLCLQALLCQWVTIVRKCLVLPRQPTAGPADSGRIIREHSPRWVHKMFLNRTQMYPFYVVLSCFIWKLEKPHHLCTYLLYFIIFCAIIAKRYLIRLNMAFWLSAIY